MAVRTNPACTVCTPWEILAIFHDPISQHVSPVGNRPWCCIPLNNGIFKHTNMDSNIWNRETRALIFYELIWKMPWHPQTSLEVTRAIWHLRIAKKLGAAPSHLHRSHCDQVLDPQGTNGHPMQIRTSKVPKHIQSNIFPAEWFSMTNWASWASGISIAAIAVPACHKEWSLKATPATPTLSSHLFIAHLPHLPKFEAKVHVAPNKRRPIVSKLLVLVHDSFSNVVLSCSNVPMFHHFQGTALSLLRSQQLMTAEHLRAALHVQYVFWPILDPHCHTWSHLKVFDTNSIPCWQVVRGKVTIWTDAFLVGNEPHEPHEARNIPISRAQQMPPMAKLAPKPQLSGLTTFGHATLHHPPVHSNSFHEAFQLFNPIIFHNP